LAEIKIHHWLKNTLSKSGRRPGEAHTFILHPWMQKIKTHIFSLEPESNAITFI
jgi:hypothetical protein